MGERGGGGVAESSLKFSEKDQQCLTAPKIQLPLLDRPDHSLLSIRANTLVPNFKILRTFSFLENQAVKDFHFRSVITIIDYALTNDVVLTTKVLYH